MRRRQQSARAIDAEYRARQAAQASTEAMLEWTSARFAGKAVPDDCSR